MAWTFEDIPDQSGRVAVVTGANSGIGFSTANMLAARNARVIMACRDMSRAETALESIKDGSSRQQVAILPLDLASLSSVEQFAIHFRDSYERLDLLINNAGVMAPPYTKTQDGFELQFGVNHLGHFALTGHLLPLLTQTQSSRVVTVSSLNHATGEIRLDDPNWEEGYSPWLAYGQSKLSNLLFAYELQRRFEAHGVDSTSLAAHPGWTATELQRHSPIMRFLNHLFAMSRDKGALTTLRAATDPEAGAGEYYGPRGLMEIWGYPVEVTSNRRSRDPQRANRLWELSEKLTGVQYLPMDSQ